MREDRRGARNSLRALELERESEDRSDAGAVAHAFRLETNGLGRRSAGSIRDAAGREWLDQASSWSR